MSSPNVAEHIVTMSPSLTFPVRAAFPLGATVSTYTLPFSSWFKTKPRGLVSSTRLSSFPACRLEREDLSKSSSPLAIERAVVDVVLTLAAVDETTPKALTECKQRSAVAVIVNKNFIVEYCNGRLFVY
eukprot:CAMPEP_0168179992 /NCGR_PEP_ID=MMETSP0139_2-20121125/10215_1 /TAXON_ID=44445 /ORGANISM="Pseudo-nitzschia australis, Strain 10249 10 AB" /LENGTH=128 /DNA_ID=CAMNT_0008100011 /DNA_START=528 /DNA_END=914 /DNA_ORIENTATION=-